MLEIYRYCPKLFTRRAEMKALGFLHGEIKNQILPILVAKPWPNAAHIYKLWEKIRDAFGDRPFFLDLCSSHTSASELAANYEFREICSPENGFENYYSVLSEEATLSSAIPVIQTIGADDIELQANQQRDRAQELDRGYLLPISRQSNTSIRYLEALLPYQDERVAICLDYGWGTDIANDLAWASPLIERALELHDAVEFIIMGSSFPESFSHIDEKAYFSIAERGIFNELARRHNRARLVYGDWGSTRPPSPARPMGNIPKRLDIAQGERWVSYRETDDETYRQIASRILSDAEWNPLMPTWGGYMIETTADGLPSGIRGPETAAAVRVNLHMSMQALAAGVILTSDDEPYSD